MYTSITEGLRTGEFCLMKDGGKGTTEGLVREGKGTHIYLVVRAGQNYSTESYLRAETI